MGSSWQPMTDTKRHPLLRVHYRDPEGWEGMLVIDSLVNGRAAGGVRVTRTVDMEEVSRLANGMTLKMRSLGLPCGGAKSAIRYDPNSIGKREALMRFFTHIKPLCEQMYGFGPDMNTSPEDLDYVAEQLGFPTRHVALTRSSPPDGIKNYHQVLGRSFGPMTVNEARSGAGTAASVLRAAKRLELAKPLRVAVQGFGQVGASTAWFLAKEGHKIVGVSDEGGYYRDPNGLDLDKLFAARPDGRSIDASRLDPRLIAGNRDFVISEECDVLVLAAVTDAVHADNANSVKAKLVVEGGNIAVTEAASLMLHGRNVLVVPDFLASGGAISVVVGVICMGWDVSDTTQFMKKVGDHIGDAVDRAVTRARAGNITVRQAALLECGM